MSARPRESFDPPPRIFNVDAPDRRSSVPPTPIEVGAGITVRAIREYLDTSAIYERFVDGDGHDPAFDDWKDVAGHVLIDARSNLLSSLLTWPIEGDPSFSSVRLRHKTAMRPRGVIHGGKLYLAIQDPDDDTPIGGGSTDGYSVMKLAIVDVANVVDVEGTGPGWAGPPDGEAATHLDSSRPGDSPGPSAVEVADAQYRAALGRYKEAEEAWDFHTEGLERADEASKAEGHACGEAQHVLVRAVMEASPRELPGINEWYSAIGPLWQAVVGAKVYCLSRGRVGDGSPNDLDEAVEKVSLTIIDLDEIGGAH